MTPLQKKVLETAVQQICDAASEANTQWFIMGQVSRQLTVLARKIDEGGPMNFTKGQLLKELEDVAAPMRSRLPSENNPHALLQPGLTWLRLLQTDDSKT